MLATRVFRAAVASGGRHEKKTEKYRRAWTSVLMFILYTDVYFYREERTHGIVAGA
jgi:hypothetical protein